MGTRGLVQAIQGPYESGAELFSCIFQLLKFPRHATVCKRGVKKNNGWIKTEASPLSCAEDEPVLLMQGKAKPRSCPSFFTCFPSIFLLHLELNENKATMLPEAEACSLLA